MSGDVAGTRRDALPRVPLSVRAKAADFPPSPARSGSARERVPPWGFSRPSESFDKAAVLRFLLPLMKRFFSLAFVASVVWLSGCATSTRTAGHVTPYHITASKPHNPDAVRVKVSTSTGTLYAMEGDRCLMAAQCCVGKAGAASPMGNHTIGEKIRNKRSGAFGFTSSGAPADIHRGDHVAVGYPMQYWCEFAPSYGFHAGYLWTEPHTHGCIRLHKEAAARLFAMVHTGTPVSIADAQPEDATFGKKVLRIDQRHDPDPPTSLLMSDSFFTDPAGPLLVEGP